MCINPVSKNLYNANHDIIGTIEYPCGGCVACRVDSMLLWSSRCSVEYNRYPSTFLTLTYDDYHLPYIDDTCIYPSLCRDDFSCFMDNLRHQVKNLDSLPKGNIRDFKYFACGEYGDMFKRPHYHLLLFGLDYLDFKNFYNKLWDFGSIKSLPIAQGGIRYVVDYMTKNINGLNAVELYDKKGLERPFYSNSRGLGSDFFVAHQQEIALTGCVKLGSRLIPVPSYYKNLCTRFDVDTLCKRLAVQRKQYLHDFANARKMNMCYDDYIAYKRKQKEKALSFDLIKYGKPLLNLHAFKDKSDFDINLIYDALYA